jgi:excisionase family DNA binding protein
MPVTTRTQRRRADFYTTGQVAKIVGCASRTVLTWIDTGRLKGFRLPGCTDRRVTRADLIAFLAAHQHPAYAELVAESCYLACGSRTAAPLWTALRAECPAAAGATFAESKPPAAIIDVGAWGAATALPLAAWLLSQTPRPRVLLVSPEDVPAADLAARCPGADVLPGPLAGADLAAWLGRE